MSKEPRPSPRAGVTWEANIGGQKVFVRSGEFLDGRLCEVFLDVSKQGTLLQAVLNGWAIAISLALQHGVPLKEYVDAYRNTKFDPCGPVVGDPDINWASSLFDYLIHRLELTYLKPVQPLAVAEPIVVVADEDFSNPNANKPASEEVKVAIKEKIAGYISTEGEKRGAQ